MIEAGVAVVDVHVLGKDRSYDVEKPVGTSGIFLQAASFSSEQKARDLTRKLVNLSRPHRIIQATSNGRPVYRVLVGPYSSRASAESDRIELRRLGFSPLFREFY